MWGSSQFICVPHEKTVYNNQHQFKDINVQNKFTHAYALPGNQKCVVNILDEHLSFLPCNAPYFYMSSFAKVKEIHSLDEELLSIH